MANSQSKAEALKNSYVNKIKNDTQLASVHIDPTRGQAAYVNDGNPNVYTYDDKGDVIDTRQMEGAANPSTTVAPNSGKGEMRRLTPEQQRGMDYQMELYKGYGTGPYADGGINLKPGAFEGPALANSMGMEQGNTATVILDLDRGKMAGRNDGQPLVQIRGNGRQVNVRDRDAAYPVPGGIPGDIDLKDMPPSLHRAVSERLYGY